MADLFCIKAESRRNDWNIMKTEQNIILDFSHIYPEDIEKQVKGLKRIDLTDISGTDMYCTEEAAAEIRKRLAPYSPCGIHFLDSGNYHYATKFFTEKIREPFALVLYDNHSDMQPPEFPGMISCGDWAGDVIRTNPCLEQLILAGPEQKTIDEIPAEFHKKLICISREVIEEKRVHEKIPQIDMELPIYISIDKDVLDRSSARTNWDQGEMPFPLLEKLLLEVFEHQQVIGADICGECSLLEPFRELMADEEINKITNDRLYHFLNDCLRTSRNFSTGFEKT